MNLKPTHKAIKARRKRAFAPDFWAFSKAGKRLADLHLHYEDAPECKLEWIVTKDKPLDYRVEKMRLSKDKTELKVNDTLIRFRRHCKHVLPTRPCFGVPCYMQGATESEHFQRRSSQEIHPRN